MLATECPFCEYDLLHAQGRFCPQDYIDATDEYPKVKDLVALCEEVDAAPIWATPSPVARSTEV